MLALLCLIGTAAAAALAPALGRRFGRDAGWPLAALLTALGVLLLVASASESDSIDLPWIPSIGVELSLRLDGLALLFGSLVLFIGALVLAYSARYLGTGDQARFYALMTFFAFAMLGLVLANDVVVLFVMWELTTLCSFFLITRSGAGAREPAVRTLLVTAAGGLMLLTAVVAMSVRVGSTRLDVITASTVWETDTTFTVVIGVLVALAAFTKCAQFPFQAWLPDAMAAATPVSAYLHAAAMVKAGIYLLMRFTPIFGGVAVWNVLLVTVGLITAVMGAVGALRRLDLKELLAYSTVSQLGFLVATIGVGTPYAMVAAGTHVIAHALFKSALFMLVGVVDDRYGTRDIRELSGVHRTMPWTVGAIAAAALSMAGIPPLLGFLSKEGMFSAMLRFPGPGWATAVVAVVAVSAAAVTVAYSARMILGLSSGPPDGPNEASAAFLLPAAIPAALGTVLAIWTFPLEGLVSDAASSLADEPVTAGLSLWHGFNTALLMSVVAVAAGVVLVLLRRPVHDVIGDGIAPFSALNVVDSLRAGSIAAGRRTGDLTRSSSPTRHLAAPMVVLTGLAIVGIVAFRSSSDAAQLADPMSGTSQPLDWVLVALIAVGTLAAMIARTRIAVVAVVGLIGFALVVWFLSLGAADVALTQLLVEILTVVVLVLVLRRLPMVFARPSRRRVIGSGALAVVAGVATTLSVLAFTGRRELSAAGEYFIREAEAETGGTNVVNTILVDFRALDTYGELTVLGVAGIAVAVLIGSRDLLPQKSSRVESRASVLTEPEGFAVFGRALARAVGPVMIVVSLILLWRGHSEPGGGFISALVGGAGFSLLYLTASSDDPPRLRLPYVGLIASGVVVATLTGFVGYLPGSFLTPINGEFLGIKLTTALVFDVGVYLTVVGVVLASLRLLGRPETPDEPDVEPPRPPDDPGRPADTAADAAPTTRQEVQ